MARLFPGQTVKSAMNEMYTIVKLLGAGYQGEVYEAWDKRKKSVALKLYFADKLSEINGGYERQYDIISNLVLTKSPDERLMWPYDVIQYNETFGYIMEIVPEGFISVRKFLSDPTIYRNGAFAVRIAFCYALADVFQKLHLRGYSYCDISDNNIMLQTKTGEIRVIDTDNVVINNDTSNIWGTMEYIAPELYREKGKPNRQSDLYSLAVLLFKAMYLHHPLVGKTERPNMTQEQQQDMYIRFPIFIFDPVNLINRPDPVKQSNPIMYWNIYPKFFNELFTKVFTVGLFQPIKRVNEAEWKLALKKLERMQYRCNCSVNNNICAASNFFDFDLPINHCWKCHAATRPFRLVICGKIKTELVFNFDPLTKITEDMLFQNGKATQIGIAVGQAKDGVLGICNSTNKPWKYVDPLAGTITVLPNQICPLTARGKIYFSVEPEVYADIYH